jgi:hypothetical protein
VFGSTYYTHAFAKNTTPSLTDEVAAENPRTSAASPSLSTVDNQLSGRMLVNHQLLSVVDTGLQVTPKLGLTFDTIFIQRWTYQPTDTTLQVQNARVDVTGTNDPQNYGLFIFLFTSVDYQLTDELNLSANYYNFGNTIGPSGKRQGMFYAPDSARFSLTATVGLDALYRRFLGSDAQSGPGASGSTRVAKAPPMVFGF